MCKPLSLLGASALSLLLLYSYQQAPAQQPRERVVRIAEIEVDPAQVKAYKAALIEEINVSIRVEPGVLTLYAVSVKNNPAQIRLFETYAGTDAYESHLRTPHFLRYKAATQGMIKSLRLVETDPILLGAKSR